ncbi:hypothetical protein JXJ21_24135 [candidate division KSB1 bacterium]|nr:hypothetical protein [candidate division KSB1 bacterium]
MEEILTEIKNAKGVIGVFLANEMGQVLANVGKFGAIPLKDVAKEILEIIGKQQAAHKYPEWLQFTYDTRIILIQVQPEFFIVSLCYTETELALIRLMLKVSISRIKKHIAK